MLINTWLHFSKLRHVQARTYNRSESNDSEFKNMLIDSQCVLHRVNFDWDGDWVPIESAESVVQDLIGGINISPESHTHFVPANAGFRLTYMAVPSSAHCRYCSGVYRELWDD